MLRSAIVPGVVLAERYEVVRRIAQGGMSEVFEATDRLLGRQVAVKVYGAGAVEDRQRFEAEVRVLAGLNHPGLVHLYDAGQHDAGEFLVLELVDGPALATVLAERGALAESGVQGIGEAVADALAYVHQAGIVHRDVTPANILCASDGQPRLADFGIARLLDSSRVTAASMTVGTVAYMAPEQVEGGDVTPAADVYALALVLHEAISGRRAFDGVGHETALARLARDPEVTSAVPARWHDLLRDMTARAPEARPSAAEVRDRIAAVPVSSRATVMVAPAIAREPAPAGSLDATAVIPSGGHGGTAVMPVGHRPAPSGGVGGRSLFAHVSPSWRRRATVAALVLGAIALAVTAIAIEGHGGAPELPREPIVEDTPATTDAPATVPTTAAPQIDEDQREDREEGGKGRGKGKDDD